jgi:pimeloyl-ACP methyl ester carboxylesterase
VPADLELVRPPSSVLLLHGFASSFEHNWRQTGWVDILADFGCKADAIDLPGHGSSTRSTEPEDYSQVEETVFASLPGQPPLHAVGFSAGADLLLRMTLAHPDHFERIALLGLGDNVFELHDSATLIEALESDEEPEDIQSRLFRRLAVSSGNDPHALSAFMRRPRQPIREEELAAVVCPVLVVLGDRDMTKSAERLIAALPSATLVTLAGVDHFATPADFGAIDATVQFLGLG